LETNLEYRKGILFIRLIGSLTKDTSQKLEQEVNDIIKCYEMKNVVINVKELNDIDYKGINILYYIYELSKQRQGKTLLCNVANEQIKKKMQHQRLLNYIKEINNELVAFDVIEI
jgi:stage II sporulation protein AA (anti-sigma F factor antagonist)